MLQHLGCLGRKSPHQRTSPRTERPGVLYARDDYQNYFNFESVNLPCATRDCPRMRKWRTPRCAQRGTALTVSRWIGFEINLERSIPVTSATCWNLRNRSCAAIIAMVTSNERMDLTAVLIDSNHFSCEASSASIEIVECVLWKVLCVFLDVRQFTFIWNEKKTILIFLSNTSEPICMASGNEAAPTGKIMNSWQARRLPAWEPPLITLKEGTGRTKFSGMFLGSPAFKQAMYLYLVRNDFW